MFVGYVGGFALVFVGQLLCCLICFGGFGGFAISVERCCVLVTMVCFAGLLIGVRLYC